MSVPSDPIDFPSRRPPRTGRPTDSRPVPRQGPITMMNGKQGTVEFRNPFDKPTDFSLQVPERPFENRSGRECPEVGDRSSGDRRVARTGFSGDECPLVFTADGQVVLLWLVIT